MLPLAPAGSAAATAAPGGQAPARRDREAEAAASFSAVLAAMIAPAPLAARPQPAAEPEGPDAATAPETEGAAAESAPAAAPAAAAAGSPAPAPAQSEAAGVKTPAQPAAQQPAQPAGPASRYVGEPPPAAAAPDAGTPAPPAGAAGGVDPRRVERSLELVAPELRVRLERVVTRMHEEHGHRVDVVETLRHQARQNHLFEQGRSRPGPVVTWTRNSNHRDGRAVDVIIDGSYGNPAAYARLQKIAVEEGLRTLGARDPGHLELPRGAGEDWTPSFAAQDGQRARFAAAAPHAQPAPVGRAAAPMAAVAPVAAVAAVAVPQVAAAAPAPATPAPPAAVATVAAVAQPGGPTVRSRDGGRDERQAPVPSPDGLRTAAPMYAAAEALPAAPGAAPGAHAGGLGAGAAARIAHLLDLQTAAPLRPLQQVILRLDGPDGQDRIRLDLRGTHLGGSIALSDPAAVERLDARLGELQRALGQRGLESETLRVRAVSPRGDTVEITRAAAGLAAEAELQRTAVRVATDTHSPRDRHAHPDHDGRRDHPEPRQGSSDPRHRSRREHNGEQHT